MTVQTITQGRRAPAQAQPVPAQAEPAARGRVPWPVLLLLLMVILVPIEFSFNLGSLLLTASRAFLFVIAFVVIPKAASFRWQSYDWFFAAHVAISCLAFLTIYPGMAGVERAGSYALEFWVVYLTVRIYMRDLAQLRALVSLLFVLMLICAALAVPEAFLRQRFVHDFATAVTGNRYPFDFEIRMGILRAASLFEHPILYGVFCSSLLSLVWFSSGRGARWWKAPAVMFATWLSASSAPLLVLILQIYLIAIERVSRGLKRRVAVFAWIVGILVVCLESFTGRGVFGTVMLVTLNPATAYTRRSQWNFGIDDVLAHPWLGFASESWTRPHWLAASVDNWWLLMMMRSGIPSVVVLALCVLTLWLGLARRQEADPLYARMRAGWGLMMIALLLGAATVTFFGKLQPLFAFYVAFGAALANCAASGASAGPAPASGAPQGGRGPIAYTRFPPAAAPAGE